MAIQKQKIQNLIQNLNKNKIPYLIIGGIAVTLYGVERATFDIDLLLPKDKLILGKLIKLFKKLRYLKVFNSKDKFLFAINKLNVQYLFKKEMVRIKNSQTVDILCIDKHKFDFIYQYKLSLQYGKTKLALPNILDLIRLKEWSGRAIDLEDSKKLRAILRKSK